MGAGGRASPRPADAGGDHADGKPCPTNVGPSGAEQNCELCEAARFTHWYYEDDTCWIADCEVCLVPMVVWKPHGVNPTDAEVTHMLGCLEAAGRTRFEDDAFIVDREMRTIPDHWHAHARDADWFRLRIARPLSRYTKVGAPRVER